jgi:hypothetical protein
MIKKKKISPYKKLSVVYKARKDTYAYCVKCNEAFLDDLPQYGSSLLCPNITLHTVPCAIIRGLTKEEIQKKIRKGKKQRKALSGEV